MRAGIGLVGILLALGVLVYFLGPGGGLNHEAQVIKSGQEAQKQAQQMSGRAEDGRPVAQTANLEAQTEGGKIGSILVVSIEADSPLAKSYGLQRNDSIIQIGPLAVRDLINNSADADAFVQDAYAKQQPLTIRRDGQKMDLSCGGATASTPTAAPAGSPPPKKSSIQDQLDAIQHMPTH